MLRLKYLSNTLALVLPKRLTTETHVRMLGLLMFILNDVPMTFSKNEVSGQLVFRFR